jgi:four helix bundle protein
MHEYKKLKVWEKSYRNVIDIYEATNLFPKFELYGLVSQIRRAALSIPANIAEGAGKGSNKDFCRFLQISYGSTNEVELYLEIAKDLKYLEKKHYISLSENLVEIRKMIAGLLSSFKHK